MSFGIIVMYELWQGRYELCSVRYELSSVRYEYIRIADQKSINWVFQKDRIVVSKVWTFQKGSSIKYDISDEVYWEDMRCGK